jgi:superfamily II DNA/RNA helicase
MTTTFADLGVPSDIVRILADAGIDSPFPIQRDSLVPGLARRDLCGRAPTGSGKTLAFGIPLVANTSRARSGAPHALVLTPTRELAGQIRDTVQPMAAARRLRVATFYGGTNIRTDQRRLRSGVDIAVATPGRLADLVQRRDIDLSAVTMVVVDEADRMADMGFLPEVTRLLDRTSSTRQTLLFSATLDGDVDVLVRRYQSNPVVVEVDAPAIEAGDIHHLFWPVARQDRRAMTADILRAAGPAIVFTRTKHGADRLARQLSKSGISTERIHGNRSQNQRERALERFGSGHSTTLVATDVAARGIHVDDVAVVVHYDPPGSDKDYVHRSGRTGRAGATGTVVSLVTPDDHGAIAAIQRSLDLPMGLHTPDHRHLSHGNAPGTVTTFADGGTSTPVREAKRDDHRSATHGRGRRSRPRSDRGGGTRGTAPSGRGAGSAAGRHAPAPRGGARARSRRA